MAIMNGKNAAIIADGTYALTPAHTKADAKKRAKRAAQFTKDSPMLKHPLKVDVDVQQAVVASSGAIVRETTGFGVLLELKRGFDREFILAIRGTQTGYDWLSNVTIGMTRGPTGALVHSGFQKIYNSMAADVRHLIKDADPRTIHFVGHSLGGALATLASLDYAKAGTADRYLYTFGAPRVGGSAMGQDLERMIGQQRIKRVYNLSDPVPLIPLYPYMHAGPGTIRLPDNFGRVTLNAHSMSGFYIPNMPAQGWPGAVSPNVMGTPDYWLRQAEGAQGFMSKWGFYALGMALDAMLPTIRLVTGLAIDAGVTLLDKLADAVYRAAQISRAIGEKVLRFINAAMRMAGQFVAKGALTLADITASFLRWVLDLMLAPVKAAARGAISLLS